MRVYLELLRPKHWIKNLAVLAPLPFGWLEHGQSCVPPILLAFVAFCLSSSACYAINDVLDREEDLLHPQKKGRPVARGAISGTRAVAFAVGLFLASLAICLLMSAWEFVATLVGYFIMILAYSLFLKHQPILDVIIIAIGFVLRTAGGAIAIDVYISPWLIVCTFTLCLFLGFGKRRSEIYAIENMEEAVKHRRTLTHYSADLLNQLLSTSAGIALITFMLYIMDSETLPGQTIVFNKRPLLYTFPLVAYGLFRYAMLIETGKVSGPTDIILQDKTLLTIIFLWVMTSGVIVLFEPLCAFLGLN